MTTFAMSWDPFRELERILSKTDRAWTTAGATPGINVYATDDAVMVTSELPGVPTADIEISLQNGALNITAKRNSKAQDGDWLVRERGELSFSRSVSLPYQVDENQVEARLKDGVLNIALKRAESDKPRRISLTAK